MAGAHPEQVATFLSAGALGACLAVKFDSTANQVVAATANTDTIAGVTLREATAADQEVAVVQTGTALVTAGGTISYGAFVTPTTGGKVIATTTAGHKIVGVARQSAVANDVFEVELRIGTL